MPKPVKVNSVKECNMAELMQDQHDITYDGKIGELYKIYALSILLSILTLGIYHFWGKTRKRRYLTSSFMLANDRFEYTGYAKELFIGLIVGVVLLVVAYLPLGWSSYVIEDYMKAPPQMNNQESTTDESEEPTVHHFEQKDAFNQNKLIAEYVGLTHFWFQFNDQGLYFRYNKGLLDVKWRIHLPFFVSYVNVQFIPSENVALLIALILIPLYLTLFFIWLPFVIVFGSLRYRVSRLRWRGIRGHLEGSAFIYASLGLIHTVLKIITLGFWIPLSDIMLNKYKLKRLYFGNQQASFSINYSSLVVVNLATIGACLYLVALMTFLGYLILPAIVSMAPGEGWLVEKLIYTLVKEGYYLTLIILIWVCYIPRYWYRAALLRGRYNNLRFGDISFTCNATGFDYLKLFVINDLIFIFTLSLGLPLLWQRRMQFFCRHIKVIGNLNQLAIEQAPGKKSKFGGGFASIMNLEIGLI